MKNEDNNALLEELTNDLKSLQESEIQRLNEQAAEILSQRGQKELSPLDKRTRQSPIPQSGQLQELETQNTTLAERVEDLKSQLDSMQEEHADEVLKYQAQIAGEANQIKNLENKVECSLSSGRQHANVKGDDSLKEKIAELQSENEVLKQQNLTVKPPIGKEEEEMIKELQESKKVLESELSILRKQQARLQETIQEDEEKLALSAGLEDKTIKAQERCTELQEQNERLKEELEISKSNASAHAQRALLEAGDTDVQPDSQENPDENEKHRIHALLLAKNAIHQENQKLKAEICRLGAENDKLLKNNESYKSLFEHEQKVSRQFTQGYKQLEQLKEYIAKEKIVENITEVEKCYQKYQAQQRSTLYRLECAKDELEYQCSKRKYETLELQNQLEKANEKSKFSSSEISPIKLKNLLKNYTEVSTKKDIFSQLAYYLKSKGEKVLKLDGEGSDESPISVLSEPENEPEYDTDDLQRQLAQEREHVGELEGQVQRLLKKNEKYGTCEEALGERLSDENRELRAECDSLRAELAHLKEDLLEQFSDSASRLSTSAAEFTITEQRSVIGALKQTLGECGDRIRELEAHSRALGTQNAELLARLQLGGQRVDLAFEEVHEELLVESARARVTADAEREELEHLRKALMETAAQRDTAEQRCQERLNRAQQECQHAEDERMAEEEAFRQVNEKLELYRAELNELLSTSLVEREKCEEELTELTQALENEKKQARALLKQAEAEHNSRLKASEARATEAYHAQIDAAQEETRTLSKQNKDLLRQVARQEQEFHNQQQTQMEESSVAMEKMALEHRRLAEEKNRLEEELRRVASQNLLLVEQQNGKAEEASTEEARLKERLRELELDYQAKCDQSTAEHKDLVALKAELAQIKEQITQRAQEARTREKELQQQLEFSGAKYDSQNALLVDLEEQVEMMRSTDQLRTSNHEKELEQKEAKIAKLQETQREYLEQIQQLQNQNVESLDKMKSQSEMISELKTASEKND